MGLLRSEGSGPSLSKSMGWLVGGQEGERVGYCVHVAGQQKP